MPPKKKIVSKVKGKTVQKPTLKPSGPMSTAADEKLVVSTANEANEEDSSTKEINTPLVTSVEENVSMLESSETETVKVVKMEEHEETKEADNKDSKPRKDMVEEPNEGEPASTVVTLKEGRVVSEETKVEGENPMRKLDEGKKQTDKEETCEDGFESVNGDDGENDDKEGNDNNSSVPTHSSPPENKKQKEFELHIGGLDKGVSEEDLTKVFGVFGEIESIRIAKKGRGFAFIRYVSFDHTQKALAELKDGAEVKGKKVRVSASQNNATTLYIGNICKSWTKERILGALKEYGAEQIENILVPYDPDGDGNNHGHVFVEFKSHADAMTVFQRLKKPDAVFGLDTSATVSFSQPSVQPSGEDLLEVKTVYLEGLPQAGDLSEIQEVCKQYGEIVRMELPRFRRKKGIGFVEFSSRDSAVACIDGFNSTQFEGNINVKASLAKPQGRVSKLPKGGFKLQNEEDTKSAKKKPRVSKEKNRKGKTINKKEERASNNSVDKATSNTQCKNLKDKRNHETQQTAKGNKRGRKDIDIGCKHMPFKKARTDNKFNSRSSYPSSSTPRSPPQPQYDSVMRSRAPSHPRTSASQYSSNDLAPHAGLLPPASQARNYNAYDERRGDIYRLQPASSYGAPHLQPASSYGALHLQPGSVYGAPHLQPTISSDHRQTSISAYTVAAPPVVRGSYLGYSTYPPGSYQVHPSSGTYNYPRSYY